MSSRLMALGFSFVFYSMTVMGVTDQANWITTPHTVISPFEGAHWIWADAPVESNQPVSLSRVFVLDGKFIRSAILSMTADNHFRAKINGTEVLKGNRWNQIYSIDIKAFLHPGQNRIEVEAQNKESFAGVIGSIQIFTDTDSIQINTDPSWITENGPSKEEGRYGALPWGRLENNRTISRSLEFSKTFEFQGDAVKSNLKSALISASGLGCYSLAVNGEILNPHALSPGWTYFPKRTYSQTYDIKGLVHPGMNQIQITTGNCWWGSLLAAAQTFQYSSGPHRILAQLNLSYSDGHVDVVSTDTSWKVKESPILKTNIYGGEDVDARLKETQAVDNAILIPSPTDHLTESPSPPIRPQKPLNPIRIFRSKTGGRIFDFGQNFAGHLRFRVKGARGQKLIIRHSEDLSSNSDSLNIKSLRGATAIDSYILQGNGESETFEPMFTYHGFRYAEISGNLDDLELDDVQGVPTHSDLAPTASFQSNSETLNSIFNAVKWTLRSNLHDVPTDCPQRDERLGWTGDIQVFASSAMWLYDFKPFFRKWIQDVSDSAFPSHPDWSGAIPDVAPWAYLERPASSAWGDVLVILPWQQYLFYGDKKIIQDHYAAMKNWVNYLIRHSSGGLYLTKGYGDWLAPRRTPLKFISAAYTANSIHILSKIARILDLVDDALYYEGLWKESQKALLGRFYSYRTGKFANGSQTSQLLGLHFELLDSAKDQALAARWLSKKIKQNQNHLSTGFLGTALLFNELSKWGYHQQAYEVATQTTYPSLGYMISKGATTIWERWDGDTNLDSMNSKNHYALGSVIDWYYRFVLGIQPLDEFPGFSRFKIELHPLKALGSASGDFMSPRGKIHTDWKTSGETVVFNIEIPENTQCEFSISGSPHPAIVLTAGKYSGRYSAQTGIKLNSR